MFLFNSAFENFKEKFRNIEKLSRKCVNLQGAIAYIYSCMCKILIIIIYTLTNKQEYNTHCILFPQICNTLFVLDFQSLFLSLRKGCFCACIWQYDIPLYRVPSKYILLLTLVRGSCFYYLPILWWHVCTN